LFLNAGITAPTGSIDQGVPGDGVFEYAMADRVGHLETRNRGLTYLGEAGDFAWGAQVLGTIHIGDNSRDYRLGDSYRLKRVDADEGDGLVWSLGTPRLARVG